jgi:hypothetical protein
LTWFSNVRGGLYEYASYNSSTSKYDATSSYGWHKVTAGYYLTTKAGCGSYAYYQESKECPADSYCPGKNEVSCDSGNAATVHTTNFGLESCPASYTANTATKKTAISQCTISVAAGKYIASANTTSGTSCAAGTYKAAHTVAYGSTSSCGNCAANTYSAAGAGSCTACTNLGSNYTTSAAGSASTGCYIPSSILIAGKYIAAANSNTISTCAAGTFKAAGTYYYGAAAQSCATCTGTTYSAAGAGSCTNCPTATNATDVVSYSYWNTGQDNDHTTREGCYANFKAKTLTNGSMTAYHCYVDQDANSYGIVASGKICWVNTSELKCNGGYYNAAANSGETQPSAATLDALFNSACVAVGAGYWSAADVLTRTACPSGYTVGPATASAQNQCAISVAAGKYLAKATETTQTSCATGTYKAAHTVNYNSTSSCTACAAGTTSPVGSDEAGDCGRKLHVGNNALYLRSVKKTTPSLNIKIDGTTFYGNMSTATKCNLRINSGGTKYSVYDDSM